MGWGSLINNNYGLLYKYINRMKEHGMFEVMDGIYIIIMKDVVCLFSIMTLT